MDERLQAVVVAGHTGDEATARDALSDESPTIRAAALGALRRMDALTAADLRVAFEDPDSGVVTRAAELAITTPDVDLVNLTTRRDWSLDAVNKYVANGARRFTTRCTTRCRA